MNKNWIKVGLSTCGIAAGAQNVFDKLKEYSSKKNIDIEIKRCGCRGNCAVEPMVQVAVDGLPITTYVNVDENVAVEILDSHVGRKQILNDHLFELEACN